MVDSDLNGNLSIRLAKMMQIKNFSNFTMQETGMGREENETKLYAYKNATYSIKPWAANKEKYTQHTTRKGEHLAIWKHGEVNYRIKNTDSSLVYQINNKYKDAIHKKDINHYEVVKSSKKAIYELKSSNSLVLNKLGMEIVGKKIILYDLSHKQSTPSLPCRNMILVFLYITQIW